MVVTHVRKKLINLVIKDKGKRINSSLNVATRNLKIRRINLKRNKHVKN